MYTRSSLWNGSDFVAEILSGLVSWQGRCVLRPHGSKSVLACNNAWASGASMHGRVVS